MDIKKFTSNLLGTAIVLDERILGSGEGNITTCIPTDHTGSTLFFLTFNLSYVSSYLKLFFLMYRNEIQL